MKKFGSKVIKLVKNNAVYFVLALCIVAIGVSVLVSFSGESPVNTTEINGEEINASAGEDVEPTSGTDTPENTPVSDTIVFDMPVLNVKQIGKYSESMVFSSTLNRYSAHLGIDFFADEGESVLAVYGGVIESATKTLLQGTTVVIDHGNNLKTVYNSLADDLDVVVGQTVAKGQKIGEVSLSNKQEYKDGAHLHFEVKENGVSIDPVKYLVFDEK